jgi:hypothetical protein
VEQRIPSIDDWACAANEITTTTF